MMMKDKFFDTKFFYTIFLTILLAITESSNAIRKDPDEDRTLQEIVRSHGLKLESHDVLTQDGYHLTLHHLVDDDQNDVNYQLHGLPQNYYHYTVDRKPIILQHGLFGSSADFFISSPFVFGGGGDAPNRTCDNLAFALHLTDRYDVWLANSRGNRYSRGRNSSTSNPLDDSDRFELDLSYWKFSFDQMATLDTPAVIDYVRNRTGRRTVGYVGFSQGTAIMFALMALRPEFADIVRPFVAMAPVTTVADIRSPIKYFRYFEPLLRELGGEFLPTSPVANRVSEIVCANAIEQELCQNIVFLLSGFDTRHLNRTRLPVYFHFLPSTGSTWTVAHWAQLVGSKRFARFDYGSAAANRAAYGTDRVPDYPLQMIPPRARIALFRGSNDYLASIPDTERLIHLLANNGVRVTDYLVPDPAWSHVDFVLGETAGRLVYDRVIQTLDQFTE